MHVEFENLAQALIHVKVDPSPHSSLVARLLVAGCFPQLLLTKSVALVEVFSKAFITYFFGGSPQVSKDFSRDPPYAFRKLAPRRLNFLGR